MQSTMILPCGVSNAPKRAVAGVTLSMSAVSSPLRNLRASSPATFTTPRSGKRAAFIANTILPCAQTMARAGSAQGQRIGIVRGLLARDTHGKFAVANARGKAFSIFSGRILAVGGDELAQRAE